MPEQVTMIEQMNRAFEEKAKELVLGMLNEDDIRRYLAETAAKTFQGMIGGYELEKQIQSVMRSRMDALMPLVCDEILGRPEFRALLVSKLERAAQKGIEDGAERLGSSLKEAVTRAGRW